MKKIILISILFASCSSELKKEIIQQQMTENEYTPFTYEVLCKMHDKYHNATIFYVRMSIETKNKKYLDSASMANYTCFAISAELKKLLK